MDAELDANIQRAMPSALKMALYTAKKQNYEMRKYVLESVEALATNASMLKDYADDDHMETLEATTKELIVLETQVNAYKTALEKMEGAIERGAVDPADFDKLVETSTDKPKINVTAHDLYKRFCEKAGIELEMDEDADLVLQDSESTRSTVCPVTQLEIENPLRNPVCGHTYSEQGIKSHLKKSRACPVAGCPQRLTLHDLERDVEMEVLIARRKNSSQHRTQHSASAPSFRADDDEEEEEEEYVVD